MLMEEKCAILDCGGQYTKVIDRKVRELGVKSEIFPIGVSPEKLKGFGGMILSGGPSSVWEKGAPEYDEHLFDLGIPTLGICYGMQLVNDHFGGKVVPNFKTEYGQIEISVDPACPLFAGLEPKQKVLMSHGDAVEKMADGFVRVADTEGVTAGIYNADKKIAAVQFHPEVDPTVNGVKMLENFLRGICGFKQTYALEDRIETSLRMIREKVGDGKVIVLVSGGVDSAVTAALLVKALGSDKVYGIHIDHGMMRKNESDLICANLADLGLTQMQRINAEDAFFNTPLTIEGEKYAPLSQTCEPEKKRAIIGHMFFVVTEEAAKKLNLDFDTAYLGQGTLRPDLIESGNPDVSGYAHKIKTHHNDVGVIRALRDRGHVVETNWDWHKDEVRQVARMLGLDEAIASRQPFPGPGLGVRILCTDHSGRNLTETDIKEKLEPLTAFVEKTDADYAADLAPIQSVGVQGDHRSYKNMTVLYNKNEAKDPADTDMEKLYALAKKIPNELNYINRVTYCLNETADVKPLVCTPTHICHETAELLRELDDITTRHLMNKNIAQCFAVLVPVSAHEGKKYSVAMRAVCTTDFMTAQSAFPGVDFPVEALKAARDEIVERFGDVVSLVLYDVTGKPPATVEWE